MCIVEEKEWIKRFGLNVTFITFLISLLLWIFFQKKMSGFQFVIKPPALVYFLNLYCFLGIDGISLFFVLLTTLLFPICILISWHQKNEIKNYFLSFLILEFFLIGAFCSTELILFYIFFESVLIPMFLIIGIWGSRERKTKASYYFFLYTLFGSILMLFSIIYIQAQLGTTNYEILIISCFSEIEQKLIWLSFFISFSSKVPSLPLHLWLPEAHVEAPTAGSVILAGILLKLGTYGFIRFSLSIFPKASLYFTPLIYTISIISLIFTSLTAIRQSDLKRTIAYTSIAHMNLVVIGIFSFSVNSIEGAILQSISHGFVASSLFLIIGIFYDRHHTKIIKYFGGLAIMMPLATAHFFIHILANMGLPGTSSFVGELLILVGLFKLSSTIGFFGAISMIISGCYSLWLYNRLSYGNLKIQYLKRVKDIKNRELAALIPLTSLTLFFGLTPSAFFKSIHISANKLVELMMIY